MRVRSRAELGHFNFRTETELTIPTTKKSQILFRQLIFPQSFYHEKSCIMISAMISINSIIIYQNFCVFKGENLIQIHNLVNFIMENNKK